MMLSVSPSCIVRSSLEEMLETLQRRDEDEMPWDVPPALPRRAVSRSRPPSFKRRLPVSSEAEENGENSGFCVTKGEMVVQIEIGAVEDFKQVQQRTPEEVHIGLPVHHDSQHLPELNTAVVTIQSYVRGEIARKEYSALQRLKKQEHLKMPPLVEELQTRLLMIEAALELKEIENASLREQVEQYKVRWSEFEAKTKSNEETLQKQITSLQMDLAAAQKSAVAESTIGQAAEREKNEGFNAVSTGVKELKAKKATFENYAKFPGLKRMMKAWTKDYKVRVRDSNTNIHPVGHSEVAGDGHWRTTTWWGKKSKRNN